LECLGIDGSIILKWLFRNEKNLVQLHRIEYSGLENCLSKLDWCSKCNFSARTLLCEFGQSGLSQDFTGRTNHEEDMKAASLGDRINFAE
jgi:hypothetical protein